MRRQLPRLALLALILVSVPASALAQDESIRLEAIRDRISLRIEFEEERNSVPRTKQEKLCERAFEKAEAILKKGGSALPEETKALKKVAVALNRWFSVEPDTSRAFAESADSIDDQLVLDHDKLADLLGSVTPEQRAALRKKDLKKLQRFIDQIDAKLLKAAAAEAAENRKKQASQLFGAAKAAAKAAALAAKLLPPPPPPPAEGGEFLAVTTGIDLSGVRQVYSLFVFLADDSALPVENQLSTSTTDVSQVQSITSIGKDCAFWLQDGDLLCTDARDPNAVGINLTPNVPPLNEEPYAVSPSGDDVVVVTRDGIAYAVEVATGISFPIGPARAPGIWFENGARPGLVLQSPTFALTAYDIDATSVTGTDEFTDDGQGATVSPDGTFIVYAAPPPFGGGLSAYIYSRITGETVEASDRLVTMNSGGDFRITRQLAAVWANPTTCFVATSLGLRALVHDPNALGLTFNTTPFDAPGRELAVCEVNSVDAVFAASGESEIVHIALPSLRARRFAAREPRVACGYDAVTRLILFGKLAQDGAPEVHRYSCETGEQEFVSRPETDAAEFDTTFIRECSLEPAGADLLFSYLVVGGNDQTAGLFQGMLTRPLEPDPATLGPVRIAGQEPTSSLEAYVVGVYLIIADQLFRSRVYAVRRTFPSGETSGVVGGATLGATGLDPAPVADVPFSNRLSVIVETND